MFLAAVLLLATLAIPKPALALGQKEFFLNSAGLELFGGANRISIAPGFNLGILSWMQFGASIGYQSLAFGDESVNTTTVLIGPTFNLDGPYSNATFIFFGYAMRKGSGTTADPLEDPAGSGIAFSVGKRIPVFGGLSYRPSIGIQMAGKTTFVLNAFAAAYLF